MNDAPRDREESSFRDRREYDDEPDERNDEPEEEPSPQQKDSFFRDLVRFSLISIVFVVPLRIFIAQPFIVQGSSMDPTFESGHYLIVDQVTYRFDEPKRGDVVIFHYPRDPSKFFIKRVIGLPNETVELGDDTITIYNEEHPDGFALDNSYVTHPSERSSTEALGSDEYFVLGDNRTSSSDSRLWGPLDERYIIGRAFLRLFPFGKLDYLPGSRDLTPRS